MADFFSRLLGRKAPPEPAPEPAAAPEPALAEPDLSFARGAEELATKTALHRQMWGLGEGDWAVDLQLGTISFTNARGWRITAPVQVIGTWNGADRTWLWGWDHPSVAPALAHDAGLVRAFGERYGLAALTTRKIEVDEAAGWDFTALAVHLAGAQGGYRGPSGETVVFMTFGEVKIVKE